MNSSNSMLFFMNFNILKRVSPFGLEIKNSSFRWNFYKIQFLKFVNLFIQNSWLNHPFIMKTNYYSFLISSISGLSTPVLQVNCFVYLCGSSPSYSFLKRLSCSHSIPWLIFHLSSLYCSLSRLHTNKNQFNISLLKSS